VAVLQDGVVLNQFVLEFFTLQAMDLIALGIFDLMHAACLVP
jgi:hypothetical protein